jgi:methionyl-tRNA formyltransferase
MEAGLDTGPVLLRQATDIGAEEVTAQLHDRLSEMGAKLIVSALDQLPNLRAVVQPGQGVTYASKIDKAEARIDWTQSAIEVDRQIRGLSPFPGAWSELGAQRVKVLASKLAEGQGKPGEVLAENLTVACGSGAVELLRLQRAGKGAQDRDIFLHGFPVTPGDCF